jgi:hypothetical protein
VGIVHSLISECAGEAATTQRSVLVVVAPHFPAVLPAVPPAPPLRAALIRLNLAAAALLTRALAQQLPRPSPDAPQQRQPPAGADPEQPSPAVGGKHHKRQALGSAAHQRQHRKEHHRQQQGVQQQHAQEHPAQQQPPPQLDPPWVAQLVHFYVGVLCHGTALPAE